MLSRSDADAKKESILVSILQVECLHALGSNTEEYNNIRQTSYCIDNNVCKQHIKYSIPSPTAHHQDIPECCIDL